MLSKQEERVLRYIVEQNNQKGVDVSSQCNSLTEAIQVVESLEKKGYVINCNTFSNAIAILKPEGNAYFEQQLISKKLHKKEKIIDWIKYGITTLIAIAALIVAIVK